MRLSALNKKLFRDLYKMKGQVFAIGSVVAAGVAIFVMYLSNFDSLQTTRQAYYERERFADVFVSLKRAPLRVAEELAAIPGVTTAETRVVVNVTLDVPGLDEPASARLISLPSRVHPQVNDVFLREGRWVDASRPGEILASEAFVRAHGFTLGSRVMAIVNGRARPLTIVGVALSPEYIYSLRPGELVPDDRRYGVFWMERNALAAAFDMEGGFNDAVFNLAPGASLDEVILRIDRVLEPWGGLGAIPRSAQLSHWMVENELTQLQSFGFVIPLIFLLVAAFILNVALTRALALERPQIASLKALGYRNLAIGWHYMKWTLVIVGGGAVLGITLGWWMGGGMIALYNEYFRFPELRFRLAPLVVLNAVGLTVALAVLGTLSAVRRAVAVPAAEAMRPEPPARFRTSLVETRFLLRRLSTTSRMILRNMERQPLRAAASIFGIGFAVAILMTGLVFIDAMDVLIMRQFFEADRQDVTLSFAEPLAPDARHALSRLPGVLAVETERMVPVKLSSGYRHRHLSVTGVSPDQRLRRILDRTGKPVEVPSSGLVLSQRLADVLHVAPGSPITVDVLEGERPRLETTVAGTVDDTMGLSAYLDIEALHHILREGDTISAAALSVDPAAEEELSRTLKRTPAVAGAAFKSRVLENFRNILSRNLNLMLGMNVLFAAIIAAGVVYNAARVSLSERSRDLASLRVLGFRRSEVSMILLGELAILTLAALPVGAVLGYVLCRAVAGSVDSEVYRFPVVITSQPVAWAFLATIGASIVSGLLVRRKLDKLDLMAVLKARE